MITCYCTKIINNEFTSRHLQYNFWPKQNITLQLKRFFFLALPPPVPPRVEPLFQPLVSLLQCDIMVHIMHLVLQRTVAVRSRSWSEAQLDRVCI